MGQCGTPTQPKFGSVYGISLYVQSRNANGPREAPEGDCCFEYWTIQTLQEMHGTTCQEHQQNVLPTQQPNWGACHVPLVC